jgi:protein disulfide-isomerase A6
VTGYPTIKLFPAGAPKSGDAEEYEGGRTSSDIVQYMELKALESAPPPEVGGGCSILASVTEFGCRW